GPQPGVERLHVLLLIPGWRHQPGRLGELLTCLRESGPRACNEVAQLSESGFPTLNGRIDVLMLGVKCLQLSAPAHDRSIKSVEVVRAPERVARHTRDRLGCVC